MVSESDAFALDRVGGDFDVHYLLGVLNGKNGVIHFEYEGDVCKNKSYVFHHKARKVKRHPHWELNLFVSLFSRLWVAENIACPTQIIANYNQNS